MALLIPEVWDFYQLSGASFFFIIHCPCFIDFSLLSSPGYSLSSPGGPLDRKKRSRFFIKNYVFQYFAYKPPFNPIIQPWDLSRSIELEEIYILVDLELHWAYLRPILGEPREPRVGLHGSMGPMDPGPFGPGCPGNPGGARGPMGQGP